MLELGSRTVTVDGVEVFSDHADPDQFWVLPSEVKLARRGADNRPQFTLIKYADEAMEGGVEGGGFLMFETNLRLDEELERRIRSRVASMAEGVPRISMVPFDEGSVEAIALNLQGSGGTSVDLDGPATFHAVERILGATTPSLHGDNTAAFSLTLSKEGATILEEVFKGGGTPVGVIYDLKFTALRPALKVEIKADFKRIFDHFSVSVDASAGFAVGGVPIFLRADVDLAFETLKQEGLIEVNVIDFTGEEDRAQKENWALEFFKNNLMQDWFKPTLTPVEFDDSSGNTNPLGQLGNLLGGGGGSGNGSGSGTGGGGGSSGSDDGGSTGGGDVGTGDAGGGSVGGSAGGGSSGSGSGSGDSGGGGSAGGSTGSGQGTGSGSTGGGGAGGGAVEQPGGGMEQPGGGVASPSGGQSGSSIGTSPLEHPSSEGPAAGPAPERAPETARREPARLQIDQSQTSPFPLPDGYGIDHTPSPEGTRETLRFRGGEEAPTVTVDNEPQTLNGRELQLDVAPGATRQIRAEYPTQPQVAPKFYLYYDFDEPVEQGWNTSPRRRYNAYLSNNFAVHQDRRFARSTGEEQLPTQPNPSVSHGATALREWIRQLPQPREVTVNAHASWESDPSDEQLNQRLSERRREVAVGIIGSDATVTGGTAQGTSWHRQDQANNVANPGEQYRVAIIEGPEPDQAGSVTIRAQLSRPETPVQPGNGEDNGGGGTVDPTNGEDHGGGGGTEDRGNGGNGGGGGTQSPPAGVSVAFKLRKIKQEELKTMTLRYNRQEAVQQRYAPQGFFGLMLGDIDPDQHFFEVNLNDPFFREFVVTAEAPFDFESIGLSRVDLSLDYGDPNDPDNHRHRDIQFRRGDGSPQEFRVLMNESFDTEYTHQAQYHFDPQSDWVGERFQYERPRTTTEDRTLLVNPFNHLGFLDIEVSPGEIDSGIVESIDVHLSYQDPDGWSTTRRIPMRAGAEPVHWKVRTSDPHARQYSYRLVHHLRNGDTRETGPFTSQSAALTVNDPFVDALDLEFEPLFDPSTVKLVFVQVEYEDPDNEYRREERLRIPGDTTETRRLRIALLNPDIRTFRYRVTYVTTDNQVRRDPFETTEETLIFLSG